VHYALSTERRYSPLTYVAALAAIFLVVFAAGRLLPAIWRGGSEYERIKARFYLFGEPWATSLLSAMPIGLPFGLISAVLAILILLRQDDPFGLGVAADGLAHAILPVFLVSWVLYMGVWLFAFPKILMPPHLRRYGGFIPESLALASAWLSSLRHRWLGRRSRK
jgi:hypothetical protein